MPSEWRHVCGRCCGGAPGYVWVSREERADIARFLELSRQDFERRYCRRVFTRVSLRERANGDCYLLQDGRCRVYPVRPPQCRSFPFWKDILASPADWGSAGRRCPGIGQGRLRTLAEIRDIQAGRRDA